MENQGDGAPTLEGPHLQRVPTLDADGRETWLQREDLGPLASFKWRGAIAHCAELAASCASGVVAASTGNFAAAVAWAARQHDLTAHVAVPETASEPKLERLRDLGAEVHLSGTTLGEAVDAARAIAEREALPYFEDGGSEAQLRGIEPLGRELAAARPTAVLVPIACGALAGGIARGLASAGSDAAVIGVQIRACSRLAARWHGYPDPPSEPTRTIADGLADDRIVEPAFGTCRTLLTNVLVVEEKDLWAAIGELHATAGVLAEGAGAAALAGLRTGGEAVPAGKVVLLVSGGNIAAELAAEVLATPLEAP